VLSVDVFDALEAFEARAGAGEEVGGGEEVFLTLGGAGVGHEGVYDGNFEGVDARLD
jgi:hypothetical protein